jgi:hypothetical protein
MTKTLISFKPTLADRIRPMPADGPPDDVPLKMIALELDHHFLAHCNRWGQTRLRGPVRQPCDSTGEASSRPHFFGRTEFCSVYAHPGETVGARVLLLPGYFTREL